MFTQLNRRLTAVLMAMAIVLSNVIMPITPAFANSNKDNNNKQVYCNIEGKSGKWKAQISNGNTEHEFKLPGVFVHDQSDVTSAMDAQCAQLFQVEIPATPIPTPADCTTAGSLALADTADYTWSTSPTYTGPGTYTATATIRSTVNKVFSDGKTSVTFENIVVAPQQDGPKCHQPAAQIDYSNWADSAPFTCGDTTVTQTRTKTTTQYAWNGEVWVLDIANAVVTSETQTRVPTADEMARCAKPADYTTTSTKTATVCLPGGGGTTTTWTTTITYTYVKFFNKWVPVFKSSETTHQSVAASEADCPTPQQVNPTCGMLGSLTLPAYKDRFLSHYTYNVWVNGIETSYSADSDAIVPNIPQGVTVKVELVITRAPEWVPALYSHTFTFTSSDCIAIPEAPASVDPCGPNNATWELPSDTTDVHWSISEDGHLIATAVGGVFTNHQSTYDYGVAQDSNEPCSATPVAPTITNCTIILPITTGITYKVVYLDADGQIVDPSQPGTDVAGQGVAATAAPGYYLTPSEGSGTFLDDGSFLYRVDLTGMTCGKGDVTPPAPTPTDNGVLPHTSPAHVTELPHTGASLNSMVIAVFAALSTYGIVYFAQPKRR